MAEAGVGQGSARGDPFYSRPRGGERWSSADAGELHSADHKCRTAPPMRLHGEAVPAGRWSRGGGTGRCQTFLCGKGMGDGGDGGRR
jgi:hypothetical protein